MGLYKRDKIWHMCYSLDGRQHRVSTGTEKKKLAAAIYGKQLVDIQEGKWFENVSAKLRTLQEMIERYKKEYTDNREDYCKGRDISIFKHFSTFFGRGAKLSAVQKRLGEYISKRKLAKAAPATIVKEVRLLGRMFNIARKNWKWGVINPVKDIELPTVSNERVRYLRSDELRHFTKAIENLPESDKWLKEVVVIGLNTALRLTPLTTLSWPELDLEKRQIFIDKIKMKNDEYASIPMTEEAFETFSELKKKKRKKKAANLVFHDQHGNPLPVRKVQRAFSRLLRAAKITNFHFHDLRHCCASYLRQNGASLEDIAAVLGHKDLRMTLRYAHQDFEGLKPAIAKIPRVITNLSQSGVNKRRKALVVPTGVEPVS
jgi:integrase